MRNLTSLQERLLRGIQADAYAIRRVPDEPGEVHRAKRELTLYGVPVDFAYWTGEPMDPAARQACRRALAKLEAAGLIQRSARWGRNLTHAKLTEAGEALAKQLSDSPSQPLET